MRRRKRVEALTEPGWDLYGLSLKEFTAARNDLAKRLRAEGDTEGAKRVKALKKPKLSAWAVNQLVRRYPQDVGALIAMTESVGTATDPHRMREASAQRQGAIAQLVDRAEELLVDEGHATGATTRQEIVQTLQATSEDGARSEALAGMLTEPLAPTGFFGVPTSDIDNEPPALSAEIQELQRRIARLEEDVARARRFADEKKDFAKSAREKADAAEQEASDALGEVELMAERLLRAKRSLPR